MLRKIYYSILGLILATSMDSIDAMSPRVVVVTDDDGDLYFDDEPDVWFGPGFYYGVWFGEEDVYWQWRHRYRHYPSNRHYYHHDHPIHYHHSGRGHGRGRRK